MTTKQESIQETVSLTNEQERKLNIKTRNALISKLEKKILFLVEENKELMNHGEWLQYQKNCTKIRNIRIEIYNNRVVVKQLAEEPNKP